MGVPQQLENDCFSDGKSIKIRRNGGYPYFRKTLSLSIYIYATSCLLYGIFQCHNICDIYIYMYMHIHVYGLLSFGSWDSHLQRSARCQVRLVILGLFITGLDWLYGLYSLYFMGSFFRLIAYFFPVGHCFFF